MKTEVMDKAIELADKIKKWRGRKDIQNPYTYTYDFLRFLDTEVEPFLRSLGYNDALYILDE